MEITRRTSTAGHLERIEAMRDNYTFQARHWVSWLRENDRDISEDSIRDYFMHLEQCGYKARTIANKRAAVKHRVREIFKGESHEQKIRIEHALKEIDKEVRAPKVNSQAVESDKVITRADLPGLLHACRSDRQRLFIRFLFVTGCRVNEMSSATLDGCEVLGDYVKITVTGKGKKERAVRIPSELYSAICQTFQGKKYLFETSNGQRYWNDYVSKQIKKIGALIGRKISAHCLRHSFVSNMIKDHPDKIDSISKYVGHSAVSITLEMYNHTSLSNNDLFGVA